MRIYLDKNVLQAAYDRLELIFREFPLVVCVVSGGKDSTVLLHLTLEVAHRLDRLPLPVFFIDQEAEWQATVDIIRSWMYRDDVQPYWFQIPFRLSNATSTREHWLHCWDPAARDRWVHEQDPISYKINKYNCDRFHYLFGAIAQVEWAGKRVAFLNGVRAEESVVRYMQLTQIPVYKHITWGFYQTYDSVGHYVFSPLYDWTWRDIWAAIAKHRWPYNRVYDYMFWAGVPINRMRVSSLHHEMSVDALYVLQEFEPRTYERLVARIEGIHAATQLTKTDYFLPELPFMFESWREYRDYLLEHLITNPEWRAGMRTRFLEDEQFYTPLIGDEIYRIQIASILTNDWEFSKYDQWLAGVKRQNYPEYLRAAREWSQKYGRPVRTKPQLQTAEAS